MKTAKDLNGKRFGRLTGWAELLGINYKTLRSRLYTYGISVDVAFSTVNRLRRNNGEE